MNPEQRERFEKQAILEAHATLLLRLINAGAEDEYLGQMERVRQAMDVVFSLPKHVQKAA